MVVIGVLTLAATTLLLEWTGMAEWLRITLVVLVAVLGLLGARATVSPTEEYRRKVPADI